jgi:hypothetical protein
MTAKWKFFFIVFLCLQAEEKRDEKEQIKKIQYMKQIQKQMTENEKKRILELKCKEEESMLISEIQMQIKLDEQEAYKRKLAEHKQTRDKLNEINSQIEHFHKMQLEEDRINDIKVSVKLKAPIFMCISRLLLLFLFHTVSGVANIKHKSKPQNIHIYEAFE